jgi:transcriptional regulator of acetoin/glycerol metabolism
MSEGDKLLPADFALKPVASPKKDAELNVRHLEKDTIRQAIRRFNGNLTRAAQELGFSRSTLYRKMKKYGIQEF